MHPGVEDIETEGFGDIGDAVKEGIETVHTHLKVQPFKNFKLDNTSLLVIAGAIVAVAFMVWMLLDYSKSKASAVAKAAASNESASV